MTKLHKCAATFAALALSLGLGARPAAAAYGSVYLYETVTTSYPYEATYRRFLAGGPFADYETCADYMRHIPTSYETGILRLYSCGY